MQVGVRTRGEHVVEISYLPPCTATQQPKTGLAERAALQLERYREDPDTRFELPLAIEGTPFQRRLWQALCGIPRGRTVTYGELARRYGDEPMWTLELAAFHDRRGYVEVGRLGDAPPHRDARQHLHVVGEDLARFVW